MKKLVLIAVLGTLAMSSAASAQGFGTTVPFKKPVPTTTPSKGR